MPMPRQLQLVSEPMQNADLIVDPGASYGEVFTRRWVVDLILDLVGYTPDRDLAAMVLVEPSCGSGAFLGPIVERLIESARAHRRDLGSMEPPVRAFDLLEANAELGILSKKLAAIMCDCDVQFHAEDFELSMPDSQKVQEIFEELEFRRLKEQRPPLPPQKK